MLQVSEEELARDVHGYFTLVEEGETIVVIRHDRPSVEIKQIPTPGMQLRPYGLDSGKVLIADDFEDPLPEELLNAFEGK